MKEKSKTLLARLKSIISILQKNKSIVLTVIYVSIVADVLFIPDSSDLRTFTILAIYIGSIRLYKLKSKATFLLCLALLGFMYVLFIETQASVTTEKAAVWLVLFWLIGIIQQWKE